MPHTIIRPKTSETEKNVLILRVFQQPPGGLNRYIVSQHWNFYLKECWVINPFVLNDRISSFLRKKAIILWPLPCFAIIFELLNLTVCGLWKRQNNQWLIIEYWVLVSWTMLPHVIGKGVSQHMFYMVSLPSVVNCSLS